MGVPIAPSDRRERGERPSCKPQACAGTVLIPQGGIFKAERSGNSLMAKKPTKSRRRRRRYLKGRVKEGLALSTLAAQTLLSDTWDSAVVERTLISSVVATWALKDITGAAGDGPIICGLAHSDYSDAEIEEVIENTGSWDEGNLVQQEVAKRKVRIVGIFNETQGDVNTAVLNDGKPIKTKLNWILTTGDTLKMWAYNQGGSALTGTADLTAAGHANLWPQ